MLKNTIFASYKAYKSGTMQVKELVFCVVLGRSKGSNISKFCLNRLNKIKVIYVIQLKLQSYQKVAIHSYKGLDIGSAVGDVRED